MVKCGSSHILRIDPKVPIPAFFRKQIMTKLTFVKVPNLIFSFFKKLALNKKDC
ncbi:hypothetical protein LEP1GSC045_1440 [Leptospira interrogans serovar Pomona str. Kennewicki LC82-25]|nr:hypothetical protein LEP1GSC045_1440 [Leptospira interrogans serovar Pomona str. Kennewicki LC82-25]EKN96375.1 hypothetical protein LEP1GSC014_0747 [Leptospira interrogans serovar Pomona str. Pomona]EMF33242.1 hypothetical protein LEP1GSC201_1301 [Leptospira interrogans serovar Pomona str. Fox 32256]EMI60635.1 hypothetical protein LEP1GSC200_0668 [Leptospira interrogans serovar Pomona str. CSL10083]EMN97939.1 hypothetical protein LEP1GSC112_1233 [Leptospira interrogans serovar Pomona str. UT